jgi:hypothetical protein
MAGWRLPSPGAHTVPVNGVVTEVHDVEARGTVDVSGARAGSVEPVRQLDEETMAKPTTRTIPGRSMISYSPAVRWDAQAGQGARSVTVS